jgi:predicted ATP-grasp superfamily ATP-dependent carboligase
VKPPRPSLLWFKYFSEKALKIHNPAELHEVYDKCLRVVDTIIIQEWVHGRDSNIYQYYYYFDKRCKQVLNYTSRKLRQWYIETGEACLVEQCHDDPVPRDLIDIYREINFQGITSLEIKIDEITGKHFIIEPDVGRPNTSIGLVEASGTPILHAMYCDALDLPVPDNTNPKPSRMKWISLRRDIESSLKYNRLGQLSFKDWLKSLKGVNTFAVFSLHDTLPSLLDGWELMRNILNSSLRKFSGFLRVMFKPRRANLPE